MKEGERHNAGCIRPTPVPDDGGGGWGKTPYTEAPEGSGLNTIPGPEPLMVVDPWMHRSAKMRCATCMWFVLKEDPVKQARMNELGRCRRHAPTMGGFPAVFKSDWCGDHKLDEGKI